MVQNLDYTSPATQYTADVSSNVFTKDRENYINVLGIQQLNTLDNVSLLDIFLSTNNVVEPHYHQNAAELVYCISGSAVVSIFNPFTKQFHHYPIGPRQVANVPQGWWHYEVAASDQTHLLAIFNSPTPDVILGSDLLKFTPSNIMAHTYCMNEKQWIQTVAPVQSTTFIGPPKNCSGEQRQDQYYPSHYPQTFYHPPY
ncbi:cupin domain-containing protein [Fictibacillus sp. KIGAM418]|uniref:Cupin domain-containing protein n=1 Tax=Fictibacillus marinisediminis TaxID=2878389 RepID=A0A9X1XFF4_9BACL|nr:MULTISPECIES: cupin domain-containing protein [Fictibacillus]MCK6258623.1 cupin domain-containing protein [Fictibacillus marinisediminis]MED2971013.1 cupin domain-containing protein [Fictibacillus sp. B-59209]